MATYRGDVAELTPEGHLRIVDRKKDLIIISGGKNISPSEIENALKVSPYINEAIVVGEGRNYLAALIQIDFENVDKCATDNPYTLYQLQVLVPARAGAHSHQMRK